MEIAERDWEVAELRATYASRRALFWAWRTTRENNGVNCFEVVKWRGVMDQLIKKSVLTRSKFFIVGMKMTYYPSPALAPSVPSHQPPPAGPSLASCPLLGAL